VKGVSGLAVVFWREGSNSWANEFDKGFTTKVGAEDDVGGEVRNLGEGLFEGHGRRGSRGGLGCEVGGGGYIHQ
jgi:hypothetical protein